MPTPAKSHGCTWHWLSQQDVGEIAGLVAAEEHFGDSTHQHDLRALQVALAEDALETGSNGVVLRKPSGTLIAYAWLRPPVPGEPDGRLHLHGGCHPAWRDEGVQDTLLRWQIDRAVEWYAEHPEVRGPLELSVLASVGNHFAAGTLPAHGFCAQKWYHALRRSLTEPLAGEATSGIAFEQFGPGWNEQVRGLYNDSIAHASDFLDPDAWAWGLAGAGIRDDLSWVAVADGTAVGWVLNAETDLAGEQAGWTEYLGAQSEWRNRGLYQALLARSHESFREFGFGMAGIGVETDSDQGARPYLELGYQLVDSMVWYVHHPALDTIGAAQADE
jgi:mycothiol synthase